LLSVHRVVESQYIILNRCLRRDCQASVRYNGIRFSVLQTKDLA